MPAGALTWDGLAERVYFAGVSNGVLYKPTNGVYSDGVAWNGLINVTEQPSGAEPNPFYADNIKYLNLISAEEFSASVECMSAPDDFLVYDGVRKTANGMRISMQARLPFGFSWQTKKGTALDEDAGFVLKLAYGLQATPSEKSSQTINDTPEPTTFTWTFSSTPVTVSGFRPTAFIEIDSTDPTVDPSNLAALMTILYGSPGVAPRLPLPDEVDTILGSGVTDVTPEPLAFNTGTDTITYAAQTGVRFWREDTGAEVLADITLSVGLPALVIKATPDDAYNFSGAFVDRWLYEYTP